MIWKFDCCSLNSSLTCIGYIYFSLLILYLIILLQFYNQHIILALFLFSSILFNSVLLGVFKYFLKTYFLFCQSEIISKSLWVALIFFSLYYSLSMYFYAFVLFGCGRLLVCQHQMLFVLNSKLKGAPYKVQSFI